MQHSTNVRLRFRFEGRKPRHEVVDGCPVIAARRVIAHVGVEHPQRHGVALVEDQIREACGDHLPVMQLGQLA